MCHQATTAFTSHGWQHGGTSCAENGTKTKQRACFVGIKVCAQRYDDHTCCHQTRLGRAAAMNILGGPATLCPRCDSGNVPASLSAQATLLTSSQLIATHCRALSIDHRLLTPIPTPTPTTATATTTTTTTTHTHGRAYFPIHL